MTIHYKLINGNTKQVEIEQTNCKTEDDLYDLASIYFLKNNIKIQWFRLIKN